MCRKQTKLALWTGTILHLLFVAAAEFSWQQCLGAHNALRAKHENTSPLKYSKDLEKEAQVYANTLAGRTGGSGTYVYYKNHALC